MLQQGVLKPTSPEGWDPRIRQAVRILENTVPIIETAALAERVGLSTFYFVRRFTREVGLSPQDYARSFFLLHAAARLRYTSDTIVGVARDFGYARHAAFTRAFTKEFGQSPSEWRDKARPQPYADAAELARLQSEAAEVRLETIAPKHVLVRRYVGPRNLMAAHWRDFLSRLPEPLLNRSRLGLSYDDPAITPIWRIRYDCAVEVGRTFKMSEALLKQGFELLSTPDGVWACSEAQALPTIGRAYHRISIGWLSLNSGWTFEGDPHLELVETTGEGSGLQVRVTVCLRLRRLVQPETPNLVLEQS